MKTEYQLGGGYWAVFEGNSVEPVIVYREAKKNVKPAKTVQP